MTDEELFSKATVFELIPYDPTSSSAAFIRCLRVECRMSKTDLLPHPVKMWAITDGLNYCLNHKGCWEYEPFPSSRTEKFLKRCRWPDLHSAVAFAEAHMAKYPTGYKPEK